VFFGLQAFRATSWIIESVLPRAGSPAHSAR
jgi:hypothetical protein